MMITWISICWVPAGPCVSSPVLMAPCDVPILHMKQVKMHAQGHTRRECQSYSLNPDQFLCKGSQHDAIRMPPHSLLFGATGTPLEHTGTHWYGECDGSAMGVPPLESPGSDLHQCPQRVTSGQVCPARKQKMQQEVFDPPSTLHHNLREGTISGTRRCPLTDEAWLHLETVL